MLFLAPFADTEKACDHGGVAHNFFQSRLATYTSMEGEAFRTKLEKRLTDWTFRYPPTFPKRERRSKSQGWDAPDGVVASEIYMSD